jgi:murein DD-endopeptidase MepM/ murein hydrolase activator NlpD
MNLGDPQSFNRFTYTNNDPVNYVDPSGLLAMDGYNDPVLMARSRVGGLLWAIQHGGIIGYTYRSGNETYSLTWMIWLVGGNANIKRCGVNPVTGRKGIVPDNSGKEGEIRPGKGGGGFHKDPRDNKVGYHTGIDISAAPGTPIFAFAPGKVQSVTGSILDRKGYGLTITIDHGNGYTSHYAHLSKEYVDKNEQIGSVKKGFFQNQQIGNAGTSGNADEKLLKEAHLHFEIRKNGKDLDPIKFLNNPCPPDFPT